MSRSTARGDGPPRANSAHPSDSSPLAQSPVAAILLATDLEASLAFYRDTLGLRLLREDRVQPHQRLVFEAGRGTQLIIRRSDVPTSDRQTKVAFPVPDIRAAVRELRSRGVTLERYVAPDPVTDDDGVADMGHSWAAWFIDPAGNCVAIAQPKH